MEDKKIDSDKKVDSDKKTDSDKKIMRTISVAVIGGAIIALLLILSTLWINQRGQKDEEEDAQRDAQHDSDADDELLRLLGREVRLDPLVDLVRLLLIFQGDETG